MKSLDTFSWEEEGGWQRRGGLVVVGAVWCLGVEDGGEWKIERAAEAHYMCHIPMTAISSYYTSVRFGK